MKVCAVFFPPPSLLILSCQWKMSNAIRREEDDELQRASEKEQEKEKRQTEWLFGPLTVPYSLTERLRQRESEEEEDLDLCSRRGRG